MKNIILLLLLPLASRAELPAQAPPIPQAPMMVSSLPDPKLYPPIALAKLAAKDGWGRPRALIEGKVTLAKKEDDGDYHFRLEDGKGNFVVLEIIPELPLATHPKVGQRIKAWGVARWDADPGHHWGELHPLVGWVPVAAKSAELPIMDDYNAAYRKSMTTGQPLVVFVSAYQSDVPGCICCRVSALGEITESCVVVAVPCHGVMGDGERLLGSASSDDILALAHKLDKAAHPTVAESVRGNVGNCPCKSNGGPCLCVPASKCPAGCPKPAQPLSFVPQTGRACST